MVRGSSKQYKGGGKLAAVVGSIDVTQTSSIPASDTRRYSMVRGSTRRYNAALRWWYCMTKRG